MVGQGCPKTSRVRAPRWLPALAALVWAVWAGEAAAGEAGVRLRIAWGGGAERLWQGTIALTAGSIREPAPLGIEADEAGSMWLEHAAGPALKPRDKPARGTIVPGSSECLVVRQRTPRAYDAVDLTVIAPDDAVLLVALTPLGDSQEPQWTEIRLADVLRGGFAGELDDRGNRLAVHRSPGDELRVRLPGRSLVFRPEDVFRFELIPHCPSLEAGAKLRLRVEAAAARGGRELWSEERTVALDSPPQLYEIPLAHWAEGVYDVTITAQPASKLHWPPSVRPQLGLRAVAERKIQLIVLGAKPPAAAGETKLTAVVEIDPANPNWWDRLSKTGPLARMPRLNKGLGNGRLKAVRHALGEAAQLAASPRDGEASWEGYIVPVSRPGVPHVLEIEYPSDVPQTLGISVVEPNPSGAVVPIGLDSGVDRAEELAAPQAAPRWLHHRLIFWPRTKTPLVLVTNRRQQEPAVYGKIRVWAGWENLPPAAPPASCERLWAGYLDRPLFPENFSAGESQGALSDLSVDDWQTFHEGGTRLVEYLQHVGYNGLMLSVYADGSSLYPSPLLEPTPRYDTGAFFATGQDPVRKDVLEMLLRMFDRQDLRLIPALEFASPLPELEAVVRAGGPEAEGLHWIGPEGLTWLQVYGPHRGKAPYYNLLHPRVQEAMLAVIRELAANYGQHPSLAGLALQLSGHGYAQLPGPEWGMDDVTIAAFEREMKLQLSTATGPDRYAQRAQALSFLGPDGRRQWRKEWLDWRAAQAARFYRRAYDELAAVRPGVRLYLAGGEMFSGPEWERELRPNLSRKSDLAEAMLRLGLDPRFLGNQPGIVVLRPQCVHPQTALASQAAGLELNQMPDVDRWFQSFGLSAALFFHPPQELRLASFDERSPFRPCYAWLAAQVVPSDQQNRRRFLHSLATFDPQEMFDGGWMLPMGQEESLRDLVAVYRRLPAVRFERAADAVGQPAGQPVAVRYATRGDRTYFYAANEAPFPTTMKVRVELPGDARVEPLVPGRTVGPLRRDADGVYWEAELAPYDLVAATINVGGARMFNPQTTYPAEVRAAIESRMGDLGDRVAALRFPPLYDALANPGFDRPATAASPLPGWQPNAPAGTTIALDARQPHGGTHSARMTSTGPTAALASDPFPPPSTGRLSLSVWLRSAANRQPPLRVVVAGKLDGRDFYRAAQVGSGGEAQPLTDQWSQFVIHVGDLPLEGIAQLHIRFELTGAGEVGIDDVQLCDLAFSKKERVELVRLLTPADVKLQNGQVADCVHLLEGYWPRFLYEHVPLPAEAAAAAETAPTREADRSPGLLERMRRKRG